MQLSVLFWLIHAVHVIWFMSCDSCHVIHVIWFMSCDSCHMIHVMIHVMWFMSYDSCHVIHVMWFMSCDSCLVFVWSEDSEEETTQSRMSHSQQEDSWADDSISLGPEGKRKVPVYSRTSYRAMSVTLCSFVQACLMIPESKKGVWFKISLELGTFKFIINLIKIRSSFATQRSNETPVQTSKSLANQKTAYALA